MIYIIILIQSILFSQGIQISSELDTNKTYIGSVINWSIMVEGGEKRNYNFPNLVVDNDTMRIRQKLSSKNISNKITFELISWDTGRFVTPSYAIEILDDNGEIDFLMQTPELEYSILSILPTLEDKNFRPLKGPVPVKKVWPIKNIILFILIILTIYGITKIWKKRQKKIYKKIDYNFTESPKDKAYRRLEELDSTQFTKEFYTQLSHIFREYIEHKYYIRTLEMTTDEINQSRQLFPIKDSQFNELITFLNRADNVKYALKLPVESEMNSDKEKIKSLILEL